MTLQEFNEQRKRTEYKGPEDDRRLTGDGGSAGHDELEQARRVIESLREQLGWAEDVVSELSERNFSYGACGQCKKEMEYDGTIAHCEDCSYWLLCQALGVEGV